MRSLIKINYWLFPALSFIGILLGLAEVYKYAGFSEKHLKINLETVISLLLLSGIVTCFSSVKARSNLDKIYKLLFLLNNILMPIPLVLSFYLNKINTERGLNYVYSIYHLQPQNLLPVIIASMIVFFVGNYLRISR